MKYLIYLSIVILFGNDSLLQKATKDFSKQSPFLFVRIKQVNHKLSTCYCLKNDDLFRLLLEDSKISTEKYSVLIMTAISKRKLIICKKETVKKLENSKFKLNKKFQHSLKKNNVQQIKNLYFKGNIMKKDISESLKLQVIYSLFLKNIFVTIDDESGEYIIY